jgi:hypothetical protein
MFRAERGVCGCLQNVLDLQLMLCEVTASDDTERAACRDAPEPEPDADAGR